MSNGRVWELTPGSNLDSKAVAAATGGASERPFRDANSNNKIKTFIVSDDKSSKFLVEEQIVKSAQRGP